VRERVFIIVSVLNGWTLFLSDPDSYNRILGCIRVLMDPKVGRSQSSYSVQTDFQLILVLDLVQTYGDSFSKGSREAFAAMLEDSRKKKPKDEKVVRAFNIS
jgi:hypothetical protein